MSDAAPQRRRRRLSLRGILPSPMLSKELVQLARSRRIFGLRSAFVGLLTLVGMLLLFTDPELAKNEGAGIDFTLGIGWLILILILLVAPVLTSGLINGEREANTLSLLFRARLSYLNIVQDKGLSRIFLLLLLALMAVPFLFAGLLFGGVDDRQVILIACAWAHAIFVASGFGLLCSSRIARPASALVVTYILLAIWVLGLPLLATFASSSLASALDMSTDNLLFVVGIVLVAINPFHLLDAVTQELTASSQFDLELMEGAIHVGVGLLIYSAAVLVGAMDLRRLARSGMADAAPRTAPGRLRRLLSPLRWLYPGVWMQRSPLVTGNPYRWRSADTLSDSLRRTITIVAVAMVALAAITLVVLRLKDGAWLTQATTYTWVYFVSLPLSGMLLMILGATVFTRERHALTWDVLLSTRLTGRSIVVGAVVDTLRYGLLVGVVPCAAILAAGRYSPSKVGWPAVAFVLVYGLLLILTALRVSLTARTSARAVVWVFIIVASACLLPLIISGLLELVAGAGPGDRRSLMAESQSPAYWLMAACERDTWDSLRRDMSRHATTAALVHFGLVLAYGWWLLFSLNRFDRHVGRQTKR